MPYGVFDRKTQAASFTDPLALSESARLRTGRTRVRVPHESETVSCLGDDLVGMAREPKEPFLSLLRPLPVPDPDVSRVSFLCVRSPNRPCRAQVSAMERVGRRRTHLEKTIGANSNK